MNRLNSNMLGSRRHDNLKKFHKKSGVYILLINSVFYVGSSSDLRKRLRWWSTFCPGVQFRTKLCVNYREQEKRVFEALKAQQLTVFCSQKELTRATGIKLPTAPPGPGRTPDRIITVDGVARTLNEWCRRNDIYTGLFYARLKIGWTEAAAVGPHLFRQGPRTLRMYVRQGRWKKKHAPH